MSCWLSWEGKTSQGQNCHLSFKALETDENLSSQCFAVFFIPLPYFGSSCITTACICSKSPDILQYRLTEAGYPETKGTQGKNNMGFL